MSAALAPGFARPVFDAQSVFRAALDALARPGRPVPLATAFAPPEPLRPELAAIALALADSDAPLWLDGPLAASAGVATFLRFHTGAPIVSDPAAAAFALVSDPAGMPQPGEFAQGTDLYPDRSTTLILSVPAFEGGPALTFSGPGIEREVEVRAAGLPTTFPDHLRANHALFPRGVDWLLIAPGGVLGIPRSSRLVREVR